MLRYFQRLSSMLSHKLPISVRTNTNTTPTDTSVTPLSVDVFQRISSSMELESEQRSGPSTNSLPLPTSVHSDYLRVLKKIQNTDIIYIQVSKHNIITTLSSPSGAALASATCGMIGFKNARKRTEFAATSVGRCIGEKTLARKIDSVHLKIKGLNFKRRIAAVKGIIESGVKIIAITDNNKVPFGDGPRPPGKRSL